jgi:hypothetical protein
MNKNISRFIAAAAAFMVVSAPASASKLSQLGNAVTYPARKAMKNTTHNTKQPVKSVTGPINQAGQTTTRTLHKVTQN